MHFLWSSCKSIKSKEFYFFNSFFNLLFFFLSCCIQATRSKNGWIFYGCKKQVFLMLYYCNQLHFFPMWVSVCVKQQKKNLILDYKKTYYHKRKILKTKERWWSVSVVFSIVSINGIRVYSKIKHLFSLFSNREICASNEKLWYICYWQLP